MKYFAILAVVVGLFFFAASPAKAQVSLNFGVNVGPQPVCPYGYFDYAPYNCSPYGYYGPEWFGNGIFMGAGPWFHGPRGFYGHVDDRYDPHYGYRGRFPGRGEHGNFRGYGRRGFHGNERRGGYNRDGRGNQDGRGNEGDHRGHGNQGDHGGHGNQGDHGH